MPCLIIIFDTLNFESVVTMSVMKFRKKVESNKLRNVLSTPRGGVINKTVLFSRKCLLLEISYLFLFIF